MNGDVFIAFLETGQTCEHCGHTEWKPADARGPYYGADHVLSGLCEDAGIPPARKTRDAAGWIATPKRID